MLSESFQPNFYCYNYNKPTRMFKKKKEFQSIYNLKDFREQRQIGAKLAAFIHIQKK